MLATLLTRSLALSQSSFSSTAPSVTPFLSTLPTSGCHTVHRCPGLCSSLCPLLTLPAVSGHSHSPLTITWAEIRKEDHELVPPFPSFLLSACLSIHPQAHLAFPQFLVAACLTTFREAIY